MINFIKGPIKLLLGIAFASASVCLSLAFPGYGGGSSSHESSFETVDTESQKPMVSEEGGIPSGDIGDNIGSRQNPYPSRNDMSFVHLPSSHTHREDYVSGDPGREVELQNRKRSDSNDSDDFVELVEGPSALNDWEPSDSSRIYIGYLSEAEGQYCQTVMRLRAGLQEIMESSKQPPLADRIDAEIFATLYDRLKEKDEGQRINSRELARNLEHYKNYKLSIDGVNPSVLHGQRQLSDQERSTLAEASAAYRKLYASFNNYPLQNKRNSHF